MRHQSQKYHNNAPYIHCERLINLHCVHIHIHVHMRNLCSHVNQNSTCTCTCHVHTHVHMYVDVCVPYIGMYTCTCTLHVVHLGIRKVTQLSQVSINHAKKVNTREKLYLSGSIV